MKTLNIFQMKLFDIIYFALKGKDRVAPSISHSLVPPKLENKYNIRSGGKLTEPFYRKSVPSLSLTIVVRIYGMNLLMIILVS